MITLEELEAKYPPRDPEAYEVARREASLSFEIAGIVYRLRKEAGLTQAELAKLLGTSQPAIARIEMPGHKPNVAMVEKIAQALGVQLHISVEPLNKKATNKQGKTTVEHELIAS
jgi:transcriptional regulator with XRE-family HTH domain